MAWKLSKTKTAETSALAKRQALLKVMHAHNLRTFVESGTYLGDTAHFMCSRGYKVITIEVGPRLAALARRRFSRDTNIRVLEGDSGCVIAEIAAALDQPALFYLDGHYSGGITGKGELETPVLAEVSALLLRAPSGSVVIIDDARCFGTFPDYPPLSEFLSNLRSKGVMDATVIDDSIRFSIRTL